MAGVMHEVVGWRCEVCGVHVDLTKPTPWRCPRSTITDRHHVLHAITAPAGFGSPASPVDHPHPFVRHDHRLAWAAAAAARGLTTAARNALVVELDEAIRDVDGVGFVTTPFARSTHLSDELGFGDGGVWIKDETGGVGGSQKARHLMSILLHLRALEVTGEMARLWSGRPRLAIASCGNAALAAATLAAAADWPIDVFVPVWMSDGFGRRLDELGAHVHRCERRADDPPGDPAMLRFREAVEAGSVPFTVQGPENALCLDGGRTIGWELAEQIESPDGPGHLDHVFVQVGGGAFAASLGAGLLGAGHRVPLHAVQAAGCAPLDRAVDGSIGDTEPGRRWDELMVPWPDPSSLADGILDDETYDWLGVVDVVRRSGGDVIVASEDSIAAAHRLAHDAGFDASATGTAGLAGLVEIGGARSDAIGPDDQVAVVMSGITR
ncbi:MAG: PLP-dependent lyase/thiolase [Ilumatobacter sp.]|uniref:PLP-dependent lyase/thiolase n=1 Tax=Ilumatobacter sp. TaxID=1967498 RepID=UPI0039197B7D